MKAPYISYSQPDANVAIMQQLKTLFDPKGILNPYKVRYCRITLRLLTSGAVLLASRCAEARQCEHHFERPAHGRRSA
jgi:hypothetical protein